MNRVMMASGSKPFVRRLRHLVAKHGTSNCPRCPSTKQTSQTNPSTRDLPSILVHYTSPKYLPGAREVQAARFIFGNPVSPSTLTKHTCISLPLATNCALVPAPRDGAMGPPACPSDPITRERPHELHIFSLRHKAIPTAYTQQCRVCRHGNNLFDSRHRRHSRPPVVEDAKNVNLPQLSDVEC
jgi:hypothetical protein